VTRGLPSISASHAFAVSTVDVHDAGARGIKRKGEEPAFLQPAFQLAAGQLVHAAALAGKQCVQCFAVSTPQWREGPKGEEGTSKAAAPHTRTCTYNVSPPLPKQ
jgi:hypothetical protein